MKSITKEGISEYWEKISSQPYKKWLSFFSEERKRMQLNDWGYAKLIYTYAFDQTGGKRNESYLFTWFSLVKSGYAARIGYEKTGVYLLVPTSSRLFNLPYFSFEKSEQRYYIIFFNNEKLDADGISTYKDDYPSAKNLFVFDVPLLPKVGDVTESKAIPFYYHGKEHKISLKTNKSIVKYFEYYPYTDMEIYFKAELSAEAKASLLTQLQEIIKDKDEKEKVGILLNFVQFATGYKTDGENFGREKPLFPDESLYYNYTDCEDRSVLFAYLVRNLTGLDVIGLDYPDHIATAVNFKTDTEGDFIEYKGRKYLICDPTYIGASIGKSMPDYKTIKPEIIMVNR